jgi:hypothetical protein
MSRKFAVEASLPEALRVPFQVLVHDYTIAAKARSDAGIPNYEILAELVRAGWRKPRP